MALTLRRNPKPAASVCELIGGPEYYVEGWNAVIDEAAGMVTCIKYTVRDGVGHEVCRSHIPLHYYIEAHLAARPIIDKLIGKGAGHH